MPKQHSLRSKTSPALIESVASLPPLRIRSGTVILDGFAARARIKDGKLHLSDRMGPHHRELAVGRTDGLEHLLILSWSGTVCLSVIEWTRSIGATISMVDRAGRLVATTLPHSQNAVFRRRAQTTAAFTGLDVRIARWLLKRKVAGQRENLVGPLVAPPAIVREFDRDRTALDTATTIDALRVAEARSAAAYWRAWATVRVNFGPPSDLRRIPEAWLRFDGRSSPLTGSPQGAVSVANATYNYVATCALSQVHLALLAFGIDVSLGWLHADRRDRMCSATCDIVETLRGEIGARVLDVLDTHRFSRGDTHEMPDGMCRIGPPLTHALALDRPYWRGLALQTVAELCRLLDRPIEQGNIDAERYRTARSLHRVSVSAGESLGIGTRPRTKALSRVRPHARLAPLPRPPQLLSTPISCASCSAEVRTRRRRYCDECLKRVRLELGRRSSERARFALTKLTTDPRFTRAAQRQRAAAISDAHRANRGWAGAEVDWDRYRSEVLPALNQLTLQIIAGALGVSTAWASRIRSGTKLPHPRHVAALETLVRGGH